jgi:hypothetical protein
MYASEASVHDFAYTTSSRKYTVIVRCSRPWLSYSQRYTPWRHPTTTTFWGFFVGSRLCVGTVGGYCAKDESATAAS